MDQNIKELISNYKTSYSQVNHKKMPPRLPKPLISEEDTFCRLVALNALEVEGRNCAFIDDEYTIDSIGKVARWLYGSSKRGLILMGTLGNGKSTMLRSISSLFTSGASFGEAQGIYDFFKQQQGGMRFWNECLLLIDDLGVEPERCLNYGEEYHPLTKLLLHRYDRCLTTIIATNLGLDDIQERYGDRLVDRMYETYDIIKYTHDSYRRR